MNLEWAQWQCRSRCAEETCTRRHVRDDAAGARACSGSLVSQQCRSGSVVLGGTDRRMRWCTPVVRGSCKFRDLWETDRLKWQCRGGSRKVEHARRAKLRHRHVHVDGVVREGYGYTTLTMQIHVKSQAGGEQGKLQ